MKRPTRSSSEAASSDFARDLTSEFVLEPGGRDEPPIGGDVPIIGVRWELVMTLFMRFTAAVWMLKGIGFWMLILGLGDLPLSEERRLRQALIVGFAILDCSASVGLWLLSPWGKSLWLFIAFVEIALGLSGYAGTVGLASASGSMLAVFCFFALALAINRQKQ